MNRNKLIKYLENIQNSKIITFLNFWEWGSYHIAMAFISSGLKYGGYGEMAQKVIEGDMSHVKSYA